MDDDDRSDLLDLRDSPLSDDFDLRSPFFSLSDLLDFLRSPLSPLSDLLLDLLLDFFDPVLLLTLSRCGVAAEDVEDETEDFFLSFFFLSLSSSPPPPPPLAPFSSLDFLRPRNRFISSLLYSMIYALKRINNDVQTWNVPKTSNFQFGMLL